MVNIDLVDLAALLPCFFRPGGLLYRLWVWILGADHCTVVLDCRIENLLRLDLEVPGLGPPIRCPNALRFAPTMVLGFDRILASPLGSMLQLLFLDLVLPLVLSCLLVLGRIPPRIPRWGPVRVTCYTSIIALTKSIGRLKSVFLLFLLLLPPLLAVFIMEKTSSSLTLGLSRRESMAGCGLCRGSVTRSLLLAVFIRGRTSRRGRMAGCSLGRGSMAGIDVASLARLQGPIVDNRLDFLQGELVRLKKQSGP